MNASMSGPTGKGAPPLQRSGGILWHGGKWGRSGSDFCFSHLMTMGSWTNHVFSLGLSFLICRMRWGQWMEEQRILLRAAPPLPLLSWQLQPASGLHSLPWEGHIPVPVTPSLRNMGQIHSRTLYSMWWLYSPRAAEVAGREGSERCTLLIAPMGREDTNVFSTSHHSFGRNPFQS